MENLSSIEKKTPEEYKWFVKYKGWWLHAI
jgi:hypothetical protein